MKFFIAKETFEVDEVITRPHPREEGETYDQRFQCIYCKGEQYRIVPGNIALEALAEKWEGEGKIEFVDPNAPRKDDGKVRGAGAVTAKNEVN